MFIIKNTVENPDPPAESLMGELQAVMPGVQLQLANYDGEERYHLLSDMIDEDDRVGRSLKRLYDGPLDDAPDEVMRQIIRELWGEDIVYLDDPRAMSDEVAAVLRKHRVRLFDDLSGRFVVE